MNTNKGLIKMIIVIVIAIVILSWYGVDLKNIFTSDQVQKNLRYVWDFLTGFWDKYLVNSATYLWGIWINYIWEPFINALEKAK